MERTEIASLGEFGLIDHLTQNNEIKNSSTVLSVGDDAAVIDHFGRQTVITTDLLVEGIHFDLAYTPLKHLGYKSVVVNLSDIYAMNATPTQIVVGIAISNKFSVEALDEFYEGIYAACEKYNVDLIGGDTTTSQRGFVISVTAIGEVAPDSYVKRSGAKVNDLICVSGDLGGAFLGLTILEREKKIFEETGAQPDLENQAYIVGRMLKPEARKDVVEYFAAHDIVPTSMMDISDGLAQDLPRLAKACDLGFHVDFTALPRSPGCTTEQAWGDGEDYELLLALSARTTAKQLAAWKLAFPKLKLTRIGQLLEKENAPAAPAGGWQHFRS